MHIVGLVGQWSLARFGCDSSVTSRLVESQADRAGDVWGLRGSCCRVCSGCVLVSGVSLEAAMKLCLGTQGHLLCVCLFASIPQTIEFDESAGAVLRIQPLRTPRDENIYECVAQNPHGEVTVHAKLTVLRGKEPEQCRRGRGPLAGWEGC